MKSSKAAQNFFLLSPMEITNEVSGALKIINDALSYWIIIQGLCKENVF